MLGFEGFLAAVVAVVSCYNREWYLLPYIPTGLVFPVLVSPYSGDLYFGDASRVVWAIFGDDVRHTWRRTSCRKDCCSRGSPSSNGEIRTLDSDLINILMLRAFDELRYCEYEVTEFENMVP